MSENHGHNGHGGIEEIIEKIDHKYLRDERLKLNKRFYDALQIDEVQKIAHHKPGEDQEHHPTDDLYKGLSKFYAHMKGYDLSEEHEDYAMKHAEAEVKQFLNQIFAERARERGYEDQWGGLRYALDEIKEGNTVNVLHRLAEVVRGQYMGLVRTKHLSDITEGDVETDLEHQGKLAEKYKDEYGGELVDIQRDIIQKIYQKASELKYHPKPKDDHGHGGGHH